MTWSWRKTAMGAKFWPSFWGCLTIWKPLSEFIIMSCFKWQFSGHPTFWENSIELHIQLPHSKQQSTCTMQCRSRRVSSFVADIWSSHGGVAPQKPRMWYNGIYNYIYITTITATNHTSLGCVRKWGISPTRVWPFKREHDDKPMVFGGRYFQTNPYLCTYFDRHWFYYFFESLLQGSGFYEELDWFCLVHLMSLCAASLPVFRV